MPARPKRSKPTRHAELVELLNTRQRALRESVREHLRAAREVEREKSQERSGEHSQPSDDVGLAVAQLQGELLVKIDAALKRVAEDRYGNCLECSDPIAIERLRALPFAVRCRACEEAREHRSTTGRPATRPTRLFGPDATY